MAALSCFGAAASPQGSASQTAFALVGEILPIQKALDPVFSKYSKSVLFFAGKLFAAANFALVYIVTAELFPTYIRTTAIGRSRLISFRNLVLVYAQIQQIDQLYPLRSLLPFCQAGWDTCSTGT